MFKKKKILSIFMILTMICMLSACGKSEDVNVDATATPAPSDVPTKAPDPTATPEPTEPVMEGTGTVVEAGKGLDFEDGNFGFIALDTAPGDADESEIAVVDHNGSKMLQLTLKGGKIPYVGIDVSSLVGDKIADVRTIQMDLEAVHPDGAFYSVSGQIYAYSGVERTKSNTPWSIYLAEKNPKVVSSTLDSEEKYFIADAKNFFILTMETDNGKETAGSATLLIDNIIIKDKDGNSIPVDSTVGFDKPNGFGSADLSNLTKVAAEALIEGATGTTTGGWGQAFGIDTLKNSGTFDPTILAPETIVTVYYSSKTAPNLILQSGVAGAPETAGWAQIPPTFLNDSGTIAQYTYEDIIKVFGTDELATYLDKLYVGDTGEALSVAKVTVGKAGKEEIIVEGAAGKSEGTWAQAVSMPTVKNGGGFDSALLVKGCIVSVYYVSTAAPEIVLQSWTEGAPEQAAWAKAAASADTGTVATFTYDDLVTAFGSTDFAAYLDTFIVGDCGAALEVTKVTVQ